MADEKDIDDQALQAIEIHDQVLQAIAKLRAEQDGVFTQLEATSTLAEGRPLLRRLREIDQQIIRVGRRHFSGIWPLH